MNRLRALLGVDWLFILACIAILAWSIVWLMYLAAFIYGKVHLHGTVTVDGEKSCLPGVSITKPLGSSDDPNLAENLSSFFQLDYPKYELLFCIQDRTSTDLIELVNGLIAKHPLVDARVFIGAQNAVINPKVNNMLNAYDQAKYPLFMISDAGIKTQPDALTDMVNHMTDKVGIVHQVPVMCDGDLRFSRQVEQLWFGGAQARVYMAANAFGVNCLTSMSCIFRKKILDEEGGLRSLGCYLGEDYFLAQVIINKGWRLVLCSQPALQNPGLSSIKSYQARMSRWMYLRHTQVPILILLEPLQEHIFLGPFTALAVYYMFSIQPYIFLPLHFLSWLIADYILLTVMQNKRPAFSIFSYSKAWFFRELSPLYLIPRTMSTKYVVWAGKKFLVRYGGTAEHAHEQKKVCQM
ncbi:ceramide glucosyltransferase-like [Watersipora subatra]|uniref:ceramide glucosyltransferase-like n=1 Tax=Watersipora subatra TaxID=2589382 RepID=UPI00355C0513